MTIWICRTERCLKRFARLLPCRLYSSVPSVERIPVRCGMSGNVNVDLHNIDRTQASAAPLLVYLPPFSTSSVAGPLPLPSFCRGLPTAVINYRWAGYSPWEDEQSSIPPLDCAEDVEQTIMPKEHLRWPAPIHDTLKAYSWLIDNLGPPAYTRRSVYVYGSYLGASLATSLALTENHPHHRMGVRGCIAYNGIYNWTMFLPNHPIHQALKSKSGSLFEHSLSLPEDAELDELDVGSHGLFRFPEHMFDHFASPCLFFHTPGLLVPPTFEDCDDTESINQAIYSAAMPTMSPSAAAAAAAAAASPSPDSSDPPTPTTEEMAMRLAGFNPLKAPRRSPLIFPPRSSTLKIPEALLLHTSPPSLGGFQGGRRRRQPAFNSFAHQAEELAGLMRKSINRLELKERRQWDDLGEEDYYDEEAGRRVQVQEVGQNENLFELTEEGKEAVSAWLEDKMDSHS